VAIGAHSRLVHCFDQAHNQLALIASKGDDARKPKLLSAIVHYFFSLTVARCDTRNSMYDVDRAFIIVVRL